MKNAKIIKSEKNNNYFEYKVAIICKDIIGKFNMCQTTEEMSIGYEFSDKLPSDKLLMVAVAQTLQRHGIIVSNIIDKPNGTVLRFIKSDKANKEDGDEDESTTDIGIRIEEFNIDSFTKKPTFLKLISKKESYIKRTEVREYLNQSIETGFVKHMAQN